MPPWIMGGRFRIYLSLCIRNPPDSRSYRNSRSSQLLSTRVPWCVVDLLVIHSLIDFDWNDCLAVSNLQYGAAPISRNQVQ